MPALWKWKRMLQSSLLSPFPPIVTCDWITGRIKGLVYAPQRAALTPRLCSKLCRSVPLDSVWTCNYRTLVNVEILSYLLRTVIFVSVRVPETSWLGTFSGSKNNHEDGITGWQSSLSTQIWDRPQGQEVWWPWSSSPGSNRSWQSVI